MEIHDISELLKKRIYNYIYIYDFIFIFFHKFLCIVAELLIEKIFKLQNTEFLYDSESLYREMNLN